LHTIINSYNFFGSDLTFITTLRYYFGRERIASAKLCRTLVNYWENNIYSSQISMYLMV